MAPSIIIGVLVLIVAAIIAYYVARFMKGKLELQLARNAAHSGEALTGRVALSAKRPIRGLLKVSLVGREKRRKRRAGSDNDTTEWVEVYRDDQILEETRDFPAGHAQAYAFEIVAPSSAEARRGGSLLRKMAQQSGDGIMGSVMSMAAGAADMFQGRVYWHIEARLDADGVDLYTKRRAQVNLRD